MAARLNEWCGDPTKPAHPFLDTQQNEALREPVQPCGLRGWREDRILRCECREYPKDERYGIGLVRDQLQLTTKNVKVGTASADIFRGHQK